jgi:hypothetical protein
MAEVCHESLEVSWVPIWPAMAWKDRSRSLFHGFSLLPCQYGREKSQWLAVYLDYTFFGKDSAESFDCLIRMGNPKAQQKFFPGY